MSFARPRLTVGRVHARAVQPVEAQHQRSAVDRVERNVAGAVARGHIDIGERPEVGDAAARRAVCAGARAGEAGAAQTSLAWGAAQSAWHVPARACLQPVHANTHRCGRRTVPLLSPARRPTPPVRTQVLPAPARRGPPGWRFRTRTCRPGAARRAGGGGRCRTRGRPPRAPQAAASPAVPRWRVPRGPGQPVGSSPGTPPWARHRPARGIQPPGPRGRRRAPATWPSTAGSGKSGCQSGTCLGGEQVSCRSAPCRVGAAKGGVRRVVAADCAPRGSGLKGWM